MLEALSAFVQPWADFYASSDTLPTLLIAVHVAAMFLGGGMAIGADGAILRTVPGSAEAVRAVMADLSTAHTSVLAALVVTFASGAALLAADLTLTLTSVVYWAKMTLIGVLLANGHRMRGLERGVLLPFANLSVHTTEMPTSFPVRQWRHIRVAAAFSLLLWCSVVVLGVVLSNG